MPIRRPILLLCAAALLASGPPLAAEPLAEVRGTWLTTTANTALSTPATIDDSMRQLRRIGLNTVYVETWKNGYTQFPSPTLEATVGVDRSPALRPWNAPARDLLEETLIEAHRNGLLYFGWFEYGFMAAFGTTQNALVQQKREWMSEDINGNIIAPNGFVWMNPLRPEVRRFLIDLIIDAVRAYDLDGIQLDDRLAWPYYTMGYDAYTRAVYAAEHGGQQPPANPSNPQWLRWRADKVTEFAEQLHAELRTERPDLLISISPAVYPWSYHNYACDWPAWMEAGWFDEFVPQVYRTTFGAFASEWAAQLGHAGGRASDLVAGIRIVGSGPDTSWNHLRQKMLASVHGGGHAHWFSRGVLELYPGELRAFYRDRGQARHPRRPADWRPAPLRAHASPDGPSSWVVQVGEANRYRVIARSGGPWREVKSRFFPAGLHSIEVPGAAEVELLVDRRPPALRFARWQEEVFTPAERADPAVSGPWADPKGHGVPNVWRYAFGLGPREAPPAGFPGPAWESTSPGTLRFVRRAQTFDLAYRLECSTDLVEWVPVAGEDLTVGPGPEPGWETVVLTVPEQGPPAAYYRLRVDWTPDAEPPP
ncbi:MAG: hypothetical protein EA425_10690 [Puniceicoccaceae bacterium]|nr:MAG: hypothetical protein EA425_10690 [Puniceicoccaceae bacterium]